jgi:DNA-binding CsgD family transcriptional regulator/PAS domain-containing protein
MLDAIRSATSGLPQRRRGETAMSEPEAFTGLVEQIYDAAVAPDRWPVFLDSLRRVFHGGPAVLFVQDGRSDEVDLLLVRGQDPAAAALYRDYYAGLNIWLDAIGTAPDWIGQGDDVVEREVFERCEFYNDWLRPQDLYFGLGAVLQRRDAAALNLSVLRAQRRGPFGDDELRLWRRLVPHVKRAVAIHARLCSLTRRQRVTSQALEDLAIGVLLLDPAERILFANAAAQQLLDDKDAIAATGSRLRACDGRAAARLSALLRDTAAGGAPAAVIMLPARSGRHLSILVCAYRPLDSDLDLLAPALMVFVGEQQRAPGILPDHIARLYGLSPAEARLAAALVAGRELPEYAEAAGIAGETARGYLKSIFVKTGTNRQSALVAALLADPILRLAGRRVQE